LFCKSSAECSVPLCSIQQKASGLKKKTKKIEIGTLLDGWRPNKQRCQEVLLSTGKKTLQTL
jgi:hypothetical protein